MKKIWRIRKQLMAACLVAVLVLSMIFVPTKKAYAIVGVDDAAFILAMMAAAGIGFVGYNAYNGSNLAEDLIDELGDIEDSVKNAYDKAVFTVLQGGGGGGDDPDNLIQTMTIQRKSRQPGKSSKSGGRSIQTRRCQSVQLGRC